MTTTRQVPSRACARAVAAATLTLVLALSGCASGPITDSESERLIREEAFASHLLWLEGLQSWQARGRMAAKLPDEAVSASMSWAQRVEHFELRLSGPFGQGAMRVDGEPGAVRLRTADGRTAHARTPEELMSRELGWEVPVSVLQYWIVGRPAPDMTLEQLKLNDDGSVSRMFQAGWDVQYMDYSEVAGGSLPRRVEVRGPQLELKLLMTRWSTS